MTCARARLLIATLATLSLLEACTPVGDSTEDATEESSSDTGVDGTDAGDGDGDSGSGPDPDYECPGSPEDCQWVADDGDFTHYGDANPPFDIPYYDDADFYDSPHVAFDSAGVMHLTYAERYYEIGGGEEGQDILVHERGIVSKYEAGVLEELRELRYPAHFIAAGPERVYMASNTEVYACVGGACDEWKTAFPGSVTELFVDEMGTAHLFDTYARTYGTVHVDEARVRARRDCEANQIVAALASPVGGPVYAAWIENPVDFEFEVHLGQVDADGIFSDERITCAWYGAPVYIRRLSLAFDGESNPHVCWSHDHNTHGNGVTYARHDGNAWDISEVGEGYCQLESDSLGRVHLFRDQYYSVFEDGTWSAPVETDWDPYVTSSAVAPDGHAVRVWGGAASITISSNESGQWVTEQIN